MPQRLVIQWTVSPPPHRLFLHYVTSVRGKDHTVTHMFMSTYKLLTQVVMCSRCVLFIVITYITSDKMLQTCDLYLCHSETAPNHIKWQILHNVAFESARQVTRGGTPLLNYGAKDLWLWDQQNAASDSVSDIILAQTGLFFFFFFNPVLQTSNKRSLLLESHSRKESDHHTYSNDVR